MLKSRWLMIIFSLALVAGCSQQPLLPEGAIQCTEPRPDFCPMNYAPVCGYQGAEAIKTYSNGCSACGTAAVSHFIDGQCP